MGTFAIAGREIGPGRSPLVIAEVGVNHNGDPELARRLVDAAVAAGADAVKFQAFEAASLATAGAERAAYQQATGAGSQLEMLRALELPSDAWRGLADRTRAGGAIFLATPFDLRSVELLADLGVPAIKVGSGDLTNAILLRAVGRLGLPVILSTGMATLDEVAAALGELRRAGSGAVAVLHCASVYPAAIEDVNLQAIDTLRDRFGDPVGFSDHTIGRLAAVAAAARGALIIEKHLTLDRALPGPDHRASMEPDDFAELVADIRAVASALGDGVKAPRDAEREIMRVARRSLVTSRHLPAGHALAVEDLAAKRPGTGISPMEIDALVGRRISRDLEPDHLLRLEDLAPDGPAG
jgi:N,N'-diacetyllegionaminate synthase